MNNLKTLLENEKIHITKRKQELKNQKITLEFEKKEAKNKNRSLNKKLNKKDR